MTHHHMIEPGDIVTRDGTDRQRVLAVDDLMVHVVCILPPDAGWCNVGDEEKNLARRYTHAVTIDLEAEAS